MINKGFSKATLVSKAAQGLVFIKHDDIICLKADRNYTQVFVFNNEMSIRVINNIGSLNLELDQDTFIQCHRSYIININYIVCYQQKCKKIVMKKNLTVPVSRSYEKGLLQRFL